MSPASRPSWRTIFAASVVALLLVANTVNALNKGGDFSDFLTAGQRMLDGQPLYAGSGPGAGVIGPPFHALVFAPFAALARFSMTASRLAWYVMNVVALGIAVWLWSRVLSKNVADRPASARQAWQSSAVLLPLAAIALPIQTNFEHQNMSALLLLLIGGSAYLLADHRDVAGGLVLGVAAALKVFPGLTIAYLVVRGRSRAAVAAATAAAVLTWTALVRYGWPAGLDTLRSWFAVSASGGWPIREQNQSLFAAVQRLTPTAAGWLVPLTVVLIIVFVLRVSVERVRSAAEVSPAEIGLVLGVSVLLSPIAWDHYWLLMFPLFVLSYQHANRRVFWVAAVLVTGCSRLTLGASGWDFVRHYGNSTLAALLLVHRAGTILRESHTSVPHSSDVRSAPE